MQEPITIRSKGMFTSNSGEWETPRWLFDILNAQFHFEIDLAASHENALCVHHFTKDDDSLAQEWRGTGWLNPPYGREIGLWTRKAQLEAHLHHATVVALLPARTYTRWFWQHLSKAEVRLLPGRLKFEQNSVPMWPAPFPSCIAIFRPSDVVGRIIKWNPREENDR